MIIFAHILKTLKEKTSYLAVTCPSSETHLWDTKN